MLRERLVDDYLEITAKVSKLFPNLFKMVSREELLSAFDDREMIDLPYILQYEIDKRNSVYELAVFLRKEVANEPPNNK